MPRKRSTFPRGRNRALGSTAILPASLTRPSGESESICRENRALGSTAILPASLTRPSGESESICREIVALSPRYKPDTRPLFARHAMPLSASAIFDFAGNTVHASAMQAFWLASPVPPVVSVSPGPPGPFGRNRQCKFICIALGFLVYLQIIWILIDIKRIYVFC